MDTLKSADTTPDTPVDTLSEHLVVQTWGDDTFLDTPRNAINTLVNTFEYFLAVQCKAPLLCHDLCSFNASLASLRFSCLLSFPLCSFLVLPGRFSPVVNPISHLVSPLTDPHESIMFRAIFLSSPFICSFCFLWFAQLTVLAPFFLCNYVL